MKRLLVSTALLTSLALAGLSPAATAAQELKTNSSSSAAQTSTTPAYLPPGKLKEGEVKPVLTSDLTWLQNNGYQNLAAFLEPKEGSTITLDKPNLNLMLAAGLADIMPQKIEEKVQQIQKESNLNPKQVASLRKKLTACVSNAINLIKQGGTPTPCHSGKLLSQVLNKS